MNNEEIACGILEKLLGKPYKELKQVYDPLDIIYLKEINRHEFWLEGEITWENVSVILRFLRDLTFESYTTYVNDQEIGKHIAPQITIHIMSCGGEIEPMFSLYDALMNYPGEVITINEGIAHSAALIIFLAGDVRIFRKYASSVAHEGSGGFSGTARETKSAMKRYEQQVEYMKEIISERTGLTVEEIDKRFSQDSDWYITRDEAMEKGFITKIDTKKNL